jgi:hypothetical protein
MGTTMDCSGRSTSQGSYTCEPNLELRHAFWDILDRASTAHISSENVDDEQHNIVLYALCGAIIIVFDV